VTLVRTRTGESSHESIPLGEGHAACRKYNASIFQALRAVSSLPIAARKSLRGITTETGIQREEDRDRSVIAIGDLFTSLLYKREGTRTPRAVRDACKMQARGDRGCRRFPRSPRASLSRASGRVANRRVTAARTAMKQPRKGPGARGIDREKIARYKRVPAANESHVMRDKPQTALAADVDRCRTGLGWWTVRDPRRYSGNLNPRGNKGSVQIGM